MVAQPAQKQGAKPQRMPIAGEAFLRALADHGIDYFFANPGTDFAPVVEAFSRANQSNAKVPRPLVIPHENLAVAMAHGAYLMTGRPQAVMVHVNVGTANAINNVINLSRERVPLILAAGGTPVTEKGAFGTRNRHIHWAQEMFDQGGMLREAVKWDYELRVPSQVGDVVSRAFEVSMTSPRGPVYLVLPREPLAAPLAELPEPITPRSLPARPHPDPETIATLAEWISKAERPLLIVSAIENDAVEPLARLAERYALPVVTQRARTMCMSSSHPMHFGFDPAGMIEDADLIVVIESDVPWILDTQPPPAGCRVAHIGEDPVFQRYPMRSFPSDLSVAAYAAHAIAALDEALGRLKLDGKKIDQRREQLTERSRKRREQNAKASNSNSDKISPAYLSRLVGETVGADAIIFNEYSMMQEHCLREKPGTYFGLSPAGGLGWGFGAALGAKLAAPEKLVVATLGDGAYAFSNPLVGHWVSQAQNLPILIVLFNNSRYGAVRNSTLSMFKDGVAGEDDGRFMADLAPTPPFEAMVQAQGGHGERVEKAADLPAALARARDVVLKEKRQALVNVMTPY